MTTPGVVPPDIYYPDSDGKPMAESDVHRKCLTDCIETLDDCFRHDPMMYVGGNMLFYYEQGNREASFAPDVFIIQGVKKGLRRSYKLWEEGLPPTVVFEITSGSTRLEDQGNKRAIYAMLGVQEYYLFDPLAEYLEPQLQGYRLVEGDYQRMETADDGSLESRMLGLLMRPEGQHLRLIRAATGERLLRPAEAAEARRTEAEARRVAEEQARVAEEQARVEAEARRAAEAEVARLREELARLRGQA